MIYNDPNRLKQILSNIIGNSIKFTYDGEITVSLSLYQNKLKIEIKDTGSGIPEKQ